MEFPTEESFAQSYLKQGPPWAGDSHFKDKDVVKLCGARFDGELKKWVARSIDVLQKLVESRKWVPVGFSHDGCRLLLHAIQTTLSSSATVGEMRFDRRNSKCAKFDAKADTGVRCGLKLTYARPCSKCGVLLDSRLQFGLECDCNSDRHWTACARCCKPIRFKEVCECKAPPAR